MNPGTPVKPTVRWRFVVDDGYKSYWEINGERAIIVYDPRRKRKEREECLEERVLRIVRKPR